MILPKETMEILQALAPELTESEDERIRKALIDGVRQIRCKNGITQEQMIAYLEKQAEQKQGKIPPYVTGFKGDPDPAGVWKPSEEQMRALNEIVNILAASPFFHQNDYLFNILNGLREELKKLL